MAIFLALAGAARIWWGAHADRVLREQIDIIRARGEPLAWKDLAPPPIPDADNAAELYKQAVAIPLLKRKDERSIEAVLSGRPVRLPAGMTAEQARDLRRLESMIEPMLTHDDFRRQHRKDLEEILALSRDALALCRAARGRKGSDWKIDFTGPALEVKLPQLGAYRKLTRLLCLAAAAAHDAGDDPEAVEALRDALAMGRSLDATPLLLAHLVGLGVDATVTAAIEALAPTLGAGAAEALRALAADLLDETARRKGLRNAFLAERAAGYDTFERFRRGEIGLGGRPMPTGPRLLMNLASGPMWKLDEARILRRMTAYVEAARRPTHPAAAAMLPDFRVPTSPLKRLGRMLSLMLMPCLERVFTLHFEAMASRRMAAAAVAIRLFQIDRGRRPEGLAELVPKYLPAVPADPFADRARPLSYLPAARPALLYSIGPDGKDDGGRFDADDDGLADRDAPDRVFFLDGDRPRQPCDWRDPTTQPDAVLPWEIPPPATAPATPTSAPASPPPPEAPPAPSR